MTVLQERLANLIIAKSFCYSPDKPFTLASGRQSKYYFNCKPTTFDPEGMNIIAKLIFDMVKTSRISAAGGLTLGADPLANALSFFSYQQGKPIKSFVVRKEAKGHGTQSAIEGSVTKGDLVLILDDVITTGASTITAIEKARAAGLIVERVIVLIDREEGGKENIEALGVTVTPLLTRSDIMRLYREKYPTPTELCE